MTGSLLAFSFLINRACVSSIQLNVVLYKVYGKEPLQHLSGQAEKKEDVRNVIKILLNFNFSIFKKFDKFNKIHLKIQIQSTYLIKSINQ